MSMRITNSIIINNFTRNLNRSAMKMNRYEQQLTSHRKILRLSDDPVGTVKILQSRSRLSDIEQYESNIRDARSWLTASEDALTDVNKSIVRAYELALDLANGTKTTEDRKTASAEIAQLRDHILSAMNTSVAGRYLFGGYNVTSEPFTLDSATGTIWYNRAADSGGTQVAGFDMNDPAFAGAYVPGDPVWDEYIDQKSQAIRYSFGYSVEIPVTSSGVNVMGVGDQNLYKILDGLYNALQSDELEDLQPFVGKLQDRQNAVLVEKGDIGGRMNRIELIADRFSLDKINYSSTLADLEEIDEAEVITNFSFAEAVYRAALGVGARVIQPTLLDFLR